MPARISPAVRSLLAAIVLLSGLAALAPQAIAQDVDTSVCAAQSTSEDPSTRSLAPGDGQLLTRDGSGFFSTDVSTMAVRSAHAGRAGLVETTDAVAEELIHFYFGTDVEVFVNEPGKSTRAVVIDGDVAVPNQPSVFTVGGVQTLYLHWTTAESDIAKLLDTPEFEAIAASSAAPEDCSRSVAETVDTATDSPTQNDSNSDADPGGEAPSDVLAYVAEDADTGSTARDTRVRTPLADSSPQQQWPFGVTAAAVVVATGGVVLFRRDRIWGDRYAAAMQPATALLEASKPSMPVADLPPTYPRVIFLDESDAPAQGSPAERTPPLREIELQKDSVESPLTKLVEKVAAGSVGSVLYREKFAQVVNSEWSRHQSGGDDGAVASLVLSELGAVRLRLGNHAADRLFREVAEKVAELSRPLDIIGMSSENELAILMPDLDENAARRALDTISKKIAATTFSSGGQRVLLTPSTGFAMLSDTSTAPDLIRAVESARALSMLHLHLDPERWDGHTVAAPSAGQQPKTWAAIKKKLTTPFQIFVTVVIAWVLPFLAYLGFDAIGFDISYGVYLLLVVALVITGGFILAECMMAVKQREPREVPKTPYPKATALIAAYLPNEAATVIETIDSFLAIDYPNDLQIILAYNTPDPLPVEEHLDRIAAEHPNFVPVRIGGSNSKAQNVNAALSMAEGEFIGMFDADHQPRPDAFTRAWRWIDEGYDVVQGHCLTRNGDAGWLAKMIAVEFESIYAVAHPGRAKMHRFGVFGGSNGFWRTELLHETRMRGSMLTEDIDSSMRVVERGFKIRSDRALVSRELATTTFKQVWNQRIRWAQGWFQVSIEHVKFGLRSKELSIRQKLGIVHLLMWRELYPWLSQQLVPLLAFWAVSAGGLGNLQWAIPLGLATSIFTFAIGPIQAWYAYRLADPEIKQHKKWFWGYLLFTTPFYTEYKNLIARVAHVKQFMGESDWRVTPRSEDPVPGLGAD